MASQVTAFINLNNTSDTSVSFASPVMATFNFAGGSHLSIKFNKCIFMIIYHFLSHLYNCLQALLFVYDSIKEIKIKKMN